MKRTLKKEFLKMSNARWILKSAEFKKIISICNYFVKNTKVFRFWLNSWVITPNLFSMSIFKNKFWIQDTFSCVHTNKDSSEEISSRPKCLAIGARKIKAFRCLGLLQVRLHCKMTTRVRVLILATRWQSQIYQHGKRLQTYSLVRYLHARNKFL